MSADCSRGTNACQFSYQSRVLRPFDQAVSPASEVESVGAFLLFPQEPSKDALGGPVQGREITEDYQISAPSH